MLATSPGMRALLELEDAAPAALFTRVSDSAAPLWPQVRTSFVIAMEQIDLGAVALGGTSTPRSSAWERLGRSMLPSARDLRGPVGSADLLYLVGGSTTHRVDGRVRNWLIGDYAEQYPERSAVLQWRPETGEPAFPRTWSLDPLVARAEAWARLTRRTAVDAEVRRLVQEFAALLPVRLPRERVDAIADTAVAFERLRRPLDRALLRVVDRFRPHVLLMEDASYGRFASFIVQVKQRGINVVEPQHGWVGPSHGAYNVGAAMRTPELAASLPDEILTFGDFWSEHLRLPVRFTPLGRPHLESMAVAAAEVERTDEVLVVSSATDPEAMSGFVLDLAAGLPAGWSVRFRPHPAERPEFARLYPRLVDAVGVVLDEADDVSASLARCRTVVGVASTVLFEAAGMGCTVFALDSPSAPYYVGDLFGEPLSGVTAVTRVVDAVRGAPHPTAVPLDRIWRPGAVPAFRDWAAERLAGH